ncbi:MAG: hypothetical protein PWR01_2740 [Clostridiales bacterium]|jgi:cell division protein FtsB|nr:hypothetical protein [Clostridiales bacterium]MDN5281667.1 hypothetical protein [Candidatus Ozemobacter sp.]
MKVKILLSFVFLVLLALLWQSYYTLNSLELVIHSQLSQLEGQARLRAELVQLNTEIYQLDDEIADLSLKNKELLDVVGDNAGQLLEKYRSRVEAD